MKEKRNEKTEINKKIESVKKIKSKVEDKAFTILDKENLDNLCERVGIKTNEDIEFLKGKFEVIFNCLKEFENIEEKELAIHNSKNALIALNDFYEEKTKEKEKEKEAKKIENEKVKRKSIFRENNEEVYSKFEKGDIDFILSCSSELFMYQLSKDQYFKK